MSEERAFHPVAELFPLLAEPELASLADDIRANGLREAIWLDKDGAIVDGRNRYLACKRAGVIPTYRTWAGPTEMGGSLVAFVVSLNLHRRHLNESQRALIAARIANLRVGQRADLKMETSQAGEIYPASIDDAAALLNVSRASVGNAKKVLREGTAEEVEAVKNGTAHVGTLAKEIRAKTSPAERRARREAPKEQSDGNRQRIETLRMKAQIWAQVRDALVNLTGLPRPADVVPMVRANDKAGLVDDRLERALNWLKEFSDEWKDHDA